MLHQAYPSRMLAVSALIYIASMFLPVYGESNDTLGWKTNWSCVELVGQVFIAIVEGTMEWDPFIVLLPFMLGFLANLYYLTAMILSWKLRYRPALLSLLFVLALSSGLGIPPLFNSFRDSVYGISSGYYEDYRIGYWLWIVSFAQAMTAWAWLSGNRFWCHRDEPSLRDVG